MTEVENSPISTYSSTPPEPDYTPPSLQEKHQYLNLLTKPLDQNYHIQINNNQYNNILTSLVNGLRRVIITDIPTISFDVESLSGFDNPNLQILKNKSKYHNDYLAHRISLIPVSITNFLSNIKIHGYYLNVANEEITMTVEDLDISKFKFKLSVINTNNAMGLSIYVKSNDMKVYYDDNEVDNSNYNFINPSIIIAKLLPLKREADIPETLNFVATPSLGYGHMHTRWSPTSNIEYWFEENHDEIQKIASSLDESKAKRFRIEQSQRLYYKNDEENPMIFNLKYKSKGSVDNYTIFKQSIGILKNKISEYRNNLQTGNDMIFSYDTNAMNALDITTTVAGHTVGNIIVEYTRYHKGVDFISYKVPHPLRKDMVVRIKPTSEYKETSDLSDKELCINIINDTCLHVIEILTVIEEEYNEISMIK
jgi:DNA-directed RNA polymerase alpha subunit/DNA-directed RNA polymerase subunit L